MRTFDDMLSKQLKDDEFRKEYDCLLYTSTEDIEIKEPKEFLSLLDVVEDETLDSLIDDNERIKPVSYTHLR